MKNKVVVITGIAGLLGSHLAERFLLDGWSVIGIDNFVGGYPDNVPAQSTLYNVDCLHQNKVREIFANTRPEVVVHAACTAYEGLSVFSPSLIFENTAGATVSVLSAAIASGVKRFVFCSSMARYGSQGEGLFYEDMTPQPQDPYGIAKVASEEVIRNLSSVHGIEYVILVPHNIIGPRQKYDDPYRNVAAIMINRMLQGKQPLIYGDGTQIRSFSFVDDVVEPIFRSTFIDKAVGQVINVGPDGNPITILELAQEIGSLLNFRTNPIFVPERPQEVKHATCSAEKSRQILSYESKTDLRSGLASMIEYIKKRGVLPFSYNFELEILSEKTPRTWTEKLI